MGSRMQRVSGLNKSDRDQIHWRAFEWAYKRLSVVARLPIFKLLHNKWFPAMEIAKFDSEKDSQCTRCKLHPETIRHIFQCPSAHAFDNHRKATAKLCKTLQKQDTTPIITGAIIQLLEHSRKGYCDLNWRNVLATDEMRELTRNTMLNQLSTGITYFLQGYSTKHWVVIQNLYRKQADFNDDNTSWARSVIARIWEYSVLMWTSRCEHVNGKTDASMRITKRKEIVKMINEHLKRTKSNPDHNVQQLR